MSLNECTPAVTVRSGENSREAIKRRLRERLATAEAEADAVTMLARNLKAQWHWLGLEEGDPVELQQLAPSAPDEELGENLRVRHRLDAATGEYRPANRYARVFRLQDALRLLAHASTSFQYQGLYLIANRLKKAVADKAKTDVWVTFVQDSGTTDKDIASRVAVMFDVDPRREDDVKDISATAEERQHAIERAFELYVDLVEILGGSEQHLALVSSGNGAQVHVRVDLPNTPDVTAKLKRLLLTLDQIHSSDTEELDTAVFDPKRLFPACGTLKRKGANNPKSGRVHRPSAFLPGAVRPAVLSLEQFGDLLAAFERRLTPEQKAAVEKDMRGAASRAVTARETTPLRAVSGESGLARCNEIKVNEVVRKLGLDPDRISCPSCGANKGFDSLESKGINVFKCLHTTCGARTWSAVDLVAKIAFGYDQLKGDRDAVAKVVRWFADNFGIEIAKKKDNRTTPSKAEREETFAAVMAAIESPAATPKSPREADATAAGQEATEPPQEPDTGPPQDGNKDDTTGEPGHEAAPPGAGGNEDLDYDALLQGGLGLDAVQQEKVIAAIARKYGITKEALRRRLAELEEETGTEDATEGKADLLAQIISEVPVVRGADNRVFGVFGNHAIPLKSGVFKARIAYLYHERTGCFVSATTIDKVVLPLLGGDIARAAVPIRFAYGTDGSIWVDLGDAKRFVRIGKDAVSVETACPIAFCRPDGLRALPEPTTPKDDDESALVLDAYREFLRLDAVQFATAWAWQVGAMRPMEVPGLRDGENEDEFAEYTVLKITGPEGTGKTTLGDYIRRPVDPRFPMHVGLPVNVGDISISGENARVLSYDNSSYIGQEHSNALARRATGDGNEVRELFTPRDQTITVGSNPVIITSIADAVTEPDLLSRCLSLDIDKPKRRTQKRKLKASFKITYPKVFGALCYCVSRALRDLDAAEVPDDIRMQDSAQWALAAASAAGINRDEVLAVFARSVEQADAIVMEKAIVVALLDVVKPETTVTLSMADLHAQLTAAYEQRVPATGTPTRKLPKDWPDKPERLRNQLKKLVPTLERAGVTIDWQQVGSRRGGRNITVTRFVLPPERDDASAARPNGRGLAVEDYGSSDGDGSGGDENQPSPRTVTAQPCDSVRQFRPGDGGDGGDGFSMSEKREKGGDVASQSTALTSAPSPGPGSNMGNKPSPASPASPRANFPGETGDTRGGDGPPRTEVAPSPVEPVTYRARVRDVRLERWMPRDPDPWPAPKAHPCDFRLVVELAVEGGGAAYYVATIHPLAPEQTMEVLKAFGGEHGPNGPWVMRPTALLVKVKPQFQLFLGLVPTVVAVGIVAAQPGDGCEHHEHAA